MTQQLKEGKHGQTSMTQLVDLQLFDIILSEGLHALFEVSKESIVISGTNGEDDLDPAQRRNGINGGNTIGHFRAWKTGGNVEGESVSFRGNVSQNSQHAHTSVLELGGTVGVEGVLVNVGRQTKGICETEKEGRA